MKKYYFKEKFFKITDKYPVLDENGKEVFFFDQDFKLIGYSAKLKDSDGKVLFTISKKIWSFLQKYFVDFNDGSHMEIDQKLSFLKRKVDIDYEGIKLHLKGSIIDHDFEIYRENEIVADMNKKFFALTDQYELTVYREDLSLILIAICLCINEMKNRDDEAADAACSTC
ncbi:LURP-one-related family protein [Anaerococcus sp. AGMB00486]|uniref:LURP-one-related family protein n=2 Tax=Anaerococcus TaxID=165779 RepID=A0ABX2NBX3_9FIRM|nr:MULTISPECIES: LURP-one-related family protein [Anaerococcus]MDY3006343.1 LURP-one-related family protein [Anaerococcus porci]MSS78770.1 hypothetical protein [Anaerococcus porci]NVF12148.1 LURP-one-related family protein [Anaerococcus faecalis]